MIKQAKEHGLDTVVFLEEEVEKMVDEEELPIKDPKKAISLPDNDRIHLPSDQKIDRLEKRVDDLEQQVGHLKTLLKARSSKRYGK